MLNGPMAPHNKFDEVTDMLSLIIEKQREELDNNANRVSSLEMAVRAFEPVQTFMEKLAAALKKIDEAFVLRADGELIQGPVRDTFQRLYELSLHPVIMNKETWFFISNEAKHIEFEDQHFLFSEMESLENAIKNWVVETVQTAQKPP